ncbi:HlyIII-domain-containing protein [Saccharata proteae CBS 121410]|uniref:HlyIII-domain-containing protein n=1 Tax=Saccharata proteae CBS 121410 TaxID=1314787 RepID=A0A9P4HS19_9PEZI|nr:HlyIII-domain-containing protein [Saccharata proteae CBS 121410]
MEAIQDTAVRAEQQLESRLTILWHQIQPWQQDNHYIHSGYRPASYSYRQSLNSLTYLHNESVNVYTHLLGAIVSLLTGLVLYAELKPRYVSATRDDVLMFGCFFVGAAVCLGCSALFHLTSNHSPDVQRTGNKLDYLGIVALIWGSTVPSVYYGLLEHPQMVRFWWAVITTNSLACAVAAVSETFRTPTFRPFRAATFVALGMSAGLPAINGIKMYGFHALNERIGLTWLVAHGAMYVLGAGIYASRIPERFYPGKFDIWGSSHQIFHVLVLCAAATHLVGLVKAFDFQHGQPDGIRRVLIDLILEI